MTPSPKAPYRGVVLQATGYDRTDAGRLGRALRFDPETEQVVGDEEANRLLSDAGRGYRAPFVIPDEVSVGRRKP